MRKQILSILVCLLLGSAAMAQNNRSAVSRNGNDLNPCTIAAPCRSFATAMNVTNQGGEIVALDSGGYGVFTANKAVTVGGAPGVHAAITVNVGAGINVSAANNDVVVIRNLIITAVGANIGIAANRAKSLDILNCLIQGATYYGIYVNVSLQSLTVEHSKIFDIVGLNGGLYGYGIFARAVPPLTAHVFIHDCLISGTNDGLFLDENTATTVTNSTLTDSVVGAYVISTDAAASAELMLESCNVSNNTTGVQLNAQAANYVATVFLSRNVFAYNTIGVAKSLYGTAFSFGNNRFVDDFADATPSPMSSIAVK
jgi:hypothetical protein